MIKESMPIGQALILALVVFLLGLRIQIKNRTVLSIISLWYFVSVIIAYIMA